MQLTAFSWSYCAGVIRTQDFVRAVDGVKRARGKRPPIFVDIRNRGVFVRWESKLRL